MHILIIGAGGMIGRKLAATLGRSGSLGGHAAIPPYRSAAF